MVFQQFKPLVWTLDDYSFKAFCILSRHFLVNHSLLSFVVFNERLFAAEHNLHGRKQKQTQTLTNCATIPAVSVTSQRDMLKNSVQCDLIPLFKWSCCTCMRSDIKRPVVIHVPVFRTHVYRNPAMQKPSNVKGILANLSAWWNRWNYECEASWDCKLDGHPEP